MPNARKPPGGRKVKVSKQAATTRTDRSRSPAPADENPKPGGRKSRAAGKAAAPAAEAGGTPRGVSEPMVITQSEVGAVRRRAEETDATVRAARLPEVRAVPAGDLAADVRDRLIRYLNDAAAVEREQAGLLQTLADATNDPELRSEFERHRAIGEEHRSAVEARVRALGGEPAGGRGLLGQLVTRVWDALQKPRGAAPDPVEDLLKALSAAEFEAGMYRAVHALAQALGDAETAEMAAAHHQQEWDFADRLRAGITPTVVRAALRTTQEGT